MGRGCPMTPWAATAPWAPAMQGGLRWREDIHNVHSRDLRYVPRGRWSAGPCSMAGETIRGAVPSPLADSAAPPHIANPPLLAKLRPGRTQMGAHVGHVPK